MVAPRRVDMLFFSRRAASNAPQPGSLYRFVVLASNVLVATRAIVTGQRHPLPYQASISSDN